MLRNNWTFPYTADELRSAASRIRRRTEQQLEDLDQQMVAAADFDSVNEQDLLARRRILTRKVAAYERYERLFTSGQPFFALTFQELPAFEL